MRALDESYERSFNSSHGPHRGCPHGQRLLADLFAADPNRSITDWLAELMRVVQAGGELDPGLSPNTLAHLCLLLAMGSALITPDLHAVDREEWAALLARVVTALARPGITAQTGTAVKVQINSERCQGHGRCYDLAPHLFGDDDEGFGKVLGDGVVLPDQERGAHLAAANCPERAVELREET